ncbi:MAG: hypothetical protein QNJ72_31365 [Pleurocapsa sp. MO_226.B13]|nr:hypothetical protein [Pleurocapsa sp. MO_226.B13]
MMKYTQEDLAAAIAILCDADLEDNEIDQIDEFVINAANTKNALEELMDAEEEGQMGEAETDAAIAQVITESAEMNLEIFDLEIEAMDEYSADNQTISFSQAMGMTLSNLIAEEYETPQAGKSAIASATGLSQPEVERLILGEAVPDTDTANSITACFSATQSEAGFKEFMSLAANAINEVAQFSADESTTPVEVLQNSSEISQLKAEFNALKQQQELGDVLRGLERQASLLVQEGSLTPFEKNKLFGKSVDREEGVALFSAACAANNVAPETQVDRISYYLSVASDRGQVIQFGEFPQDDSGVQVIDRAAETEAQDFINRNGLI